MKVKILKSNTSTLEAHEDAVNEFTSTKGVQAIKVENMIATTAVSLDNASSEQSELVTVITYFDNRSSELANPMPKRS